MRWLYFRLWNLRDQNLLRLTVHNVYLSRKSFGKKPCLPQPMNLLARMEEFLKRRYEFRKNEIIGEVEYREKHSFCFRFRPVTPEVLGTGWRTRDFEIDVFPFASAACVKGLSCGKY